MVSRKKKSLQEIGYVIVLLAAIFILFQWYTVQNSHRMEERNKNYAEDSARLMATKINEELKNAQNTIDIYAYFTGKSMAGSGIDAKALGEIEENSMLFDAVLFTDRDGTDYISDGRTADVTGREFYIRGIEGERGISLIFDPYFFNEVMACFYAPVYSEGEIIGVLRGAYLAEEYLKSMLSTTYFGEAADVYLCMPDGRVIASSTDMALEGDLLDILTESGVIDTGTAGKVKGVFESGGEGSFICDSKSKTDNICVMYLPDHKYVMVQTFPKSVTRMMIRAENLVGIRLEIMLGILFAIYIAALLFRAGRAKKILERINREMSYIIDGINTL